MQVLRNVCNHVSPIGSVQVSWPKGKGSPMPSCVRGGEVLERGMGRSLHLPSCHETRLRRRAWPISLLGYSPNGTFTWALPKHAKIPRPRPALSGATGSRKLQSPVASLPTWKLGSTEYSCCNVKSFCGFHKDTGGISNNWLP